MVLGVSHSDNLLYVTLPKVIVNQQKLRAQQCWKLAIAHSEM